MSNVKVMSLSFPAASCTDEIVSAVPFATASPLPSVIVTVLLLLDHAVLADEPYVSVAAPIAVDIELVFPTASVNVSAILSPASALDADGVESAAAIGMLSITIAELSERF